MTLKGKTAIVTGGGRDIGRACAMRLAEEGAMVAINYFSSSAGADSAVEEIRSRGGKAFALCGDLTTRDGADALVKRTLEEFGGIDILVNNTGGPPPGGAVGMDVGVLEKQFQMMVQRVIDLTNRVLPGMREAGWGRILTIASSGVIQPIPNLALSNTLRSALVGWSKSLSNEVAGDGVCVNMLLPGRIHTERVDELDNANASKSGKAVEDVREASRLAIPAKRYGDVAEFAAVAAFLVSGKASYVTGSVIRCDGGATKSV